LLAGILEMELHEQELASAFALWTVGRRGELFNTGRDTLKLLSIAAHQNETARRHNR
jgi:hypothetical protein